jgi:O-antigen/teichoic acid export membrane protein
MVGGVALAVLLVAGPLAFRLVFGPEWVESGRYAQALGVAVAGQVVAAPLSQTLIALEKTVVQFCWDAGRLVLAVGAVAVSVALGWSALTAVWTLGLVSGTTYVVSWFLSRRALTAAMVG